MSRCTTRVWISAPSKIKLVIGFTEELFIISLPDKEPVYLIICILERRSGVTLKSLTFYLYLIVRLLPWLQLDGDTLFLSQAADIKVYHIHKDSGRLQRSPFEVYSGHKGDVCRFVLTDSLLISGGR